MSKGEFLLTGGAAALVAVANPFDPLPAAWRTFRLTTTVTLPAGGPAQIWLPNGRIEQRATHGYVRGGSEDAQSKCRPPRSVFVSDYGWVGAWEGNWIAYNDAHDVTLTDSNGKAVPFLMYPQAEIDGQRLDPLDAETFSYTIEVAEASST